MKYLKIYEDFDWSEEDFDYEEEKISTLIDNLNIKDYERNNTLIVKVFLKDWNRFRNETKHQLNIDIFDRYLNECDNFIYIFIDKLKSTFSVGYMNDRPQSIEWTYYNYKNNGYYDYSNSKMEKFNSSI